MAESEAIQTAVKQVAIHSATATVMVLRETDAGLISGTSMANMGEAYIYRHGGPVLRQPSFDWNASDRYIELLSFEMEVTNILQTKTY